MTIVNDDSRVVNKLEASLTDDARVVIYDRQMFIEQATDYFLLQIAFPVFRKTSRWRHDIQQNDIKHSDIQHKDTQHK
jgi:hypothetical protein